MKAIELTGTTNPFPKASRSWEHKARLKKIWKDQTPLPLVNEVDGIVHENPANHVLRQTEPKPKVSSGQTQFLPLLGTTHEYPTCSCAITFHPPNLPIDTYYCCSHQLLVGIIDSQKVPRFFHLVVLAHILCTFPSSHQQLAVRQGRLGAIGVKWRILACRNRDRVT